MIHHLFMFAFSGEKFFMVDKPVHIKNYQIFLSKTLILENSEKKNWEISINLDWEKKIYRIFFF